MIIIMNMNKNKKCVKCGYEWEMRVDNPKECPKCKQRQDK